MPRSPTGVLAHASETKDLLTLKYHACCFGSTTQSMLVVIYAAERSCPEFQGAALLQVFYGHCKHPEGAGGMGWIPDSTRFGGVWGLD